MLRIKVGILCAAVGVFGLSAVPALAQHGLGGGHGGGHGGFGVDFHGGVARHQQGHVLHDPHGRRVVDHHDDYHYVVPAHQNHGTFYSYQDARYYTPPAVSGHDVYRPVVVEYGGFSHVEQLSSRLESAANLLCLDLYHNYRHNPGFREVYREAYQILTKAKYIHGSEHGGDKEAIRQTLSAIDNQFHHVVTDLQGWTRDVHRHVGHGDIGEKIAETEALIHHLMYDVGVQPAHDAANAPAGGGPFAPSGGGETAPNLDGASGIAPELPPAAGGASAP